MRCNTHSHLRTGLLALVMALGGLVLSSCGGGGGGGDDGEGAMIVPRPGGPDLVVSNFSVGEQNPSPGARIQLSATVENRGDRQSQSTDLRYYLSDDSTISRDDAEVGDDTVGSLDGGEASDESIFENVPRNAGTYFYGACVVAVTGESDTGNNCSRGVRVTITASPTPDLIVSRFSVDEQNPAPGARIRLSATVENRGDAGSRRTTLRYYLSNDSTISTQDTEVETDVVGSLAPGRDSDESTPSRFTAPTRAGTYYYGACVDSVTDESNTRNNCSRGVRATVRQLYGAVSAGNLGAFCQSGYVAAVVVNFDSASVARQQAIDVLPVEGRCELQRGRCVHNMRSCIRRTECQYLWGRYWLPRLCRIGVFRERGRKECTS